MWSRTVPTSSQLTPVRPAAAQEIVSLSLNVWIRCANAMPVFQVPPVTRASILCMALIVQASVNGMKRATKQAGARRKGTASVLREETPSACTVKSALRTTFSKTARARRALGTRAAARTGDASGTLPANATMAGLALRATLAHQAGLAITASSRARTNHASMECAAPAGASASLGLAEFHAQRVRRFMGWKAVVCRAAPRIHVTPWGDARPRAPASASLLSIAAESGKL